MSNNQCKQCNKPAVVTLSGVLYCVKHWKEEDEKCKNNINML